MNRLLLFLGEKVLAANEVNLLQPLDRSGGGQGTTAISRVSDYIGIVFPVLLGVAAALSVVMITWGGLEYMLSKIPGAKVEGKERIKNALWGLLLALVAWVILNTINTSISTTTL